MGTNMSQLRLAALISGFAAGLLLPSAEFIHAAENSKAIIGTTSAGGQFSEANMQFDFALGLLRRGLAKEAVAEFGKFITTYPSSTRMNEALLHRAEGFFTLADFQSAARDYAHYLSATPNADTGSRLRYGISLFELKNFKGALQQLAPLANSEDKTEHQQSALYYAALCQQKSGQTQQSRKSLAQITGGGMRPLALYALAESYLEEKDYSRAAEFFHEVSQEYPAHALATRAQLARADALRLSGRLGESEADFASLLTSDDPTVRLRAEYGLAWTNFGNKHPEDAAKLARKVLASPQGKEFYDGANYLLGSIEFASKKYAAAAESFARVKPGDFSARAGLARGWALYELKDFSSALQVAQEGAHAHPTFPADEFSYLAGRCFLELKQYPQAAQTFLNARAVQGARHERAAFELGLAQEQAGNFPASSEARDYFIRTFPQSELATEAYAGLGRTLIAAGRYEAAIPVYSAFLTRPELTPLQTEQALGRQAVCYYYLKQYDNMAGIYEKILTKFPTSSAAAEALFWLAWHDSTRKKHLQAAARYEELLKRFPAHALAPKARYYLGSSYLHGGEEGKAATVFFALATDTEATGTTSPQHPVLEGRELLWLGQYYTVHQDLTKAQRIYELLLRREKPGLVRAVALRGQAEGKRQAKDWQGSLASYDALLNLLQEIEGQQGMLAALRNEALYGSAICLREIGKLPQARQRLGDIDAGADDPFMARVIFERGLLDFAEAKYANAAENLMRVGLLVDDEALAGQALIKAGEACEMANDPEKARICWDELAGKLEGSYGRLYPNNSYTAIGKKKSERTPTLKP